MENTIYDKFILFIVCILPLIIAPWMKDYFYLPKALILYILCAFLFIYMIINKVKLNLKSYNILAFSYLLIIFLSTIFSVNISQSIWGRKSRYDGLITYICYILLFTISSDLYTLKEKHLKYMVFTGVLICLYSIFQYLGLDIIPPDEIRKDWHIYSYVFSTLGNPDFLGSYITLILPISIFLFLHLNEKKYLFSSLILFIALLCSKTRSAWIGCTLSFILLVILSIKNKVGVKSLIILTSVFILASIIINFYSNNEVLLRFKTIFIDFISVCKNSPYKQTAGSSRIFIWGKAIKLIPSKPILGYGPDTFNIPFMSNYGSEVKETLGNLIIDKAHNEYLQIAVTTGIPSLIVYLLLIVTSIINGFKAINKNILIIPFICSIIGYIIQAFFNISVVSVAPIYFCFLGILNSINKCPQ
ncbi:MAG TPA: hypothetical protein DEF85_06970 [Clostridiaceae bacterium]|jgi:putative inorganic carbon (HCO3(-)) transporter|nr:hypothetical protein [Clostridiaceae bacterium]HBG39682.1 hypothetical protein [Clostridiaceae bacterium]HBN29620.1 hypothetical protein [Clostridiaceae bacterium]HBX48615.1 hypothetical protein [Clostridiaceae bacterium]HCL49613.1 hypothetical protein [Clostridiaceae bacterium]